MNRMIVLGLFVVVSWSGFGQTLKKETTPFNEANLIEIQTENTNQELFEIVAKELVKKGFVFKNYNKEYFYIETELMSPFDQTKQQQYYVFIFDSKIRMYSSSFTNGLGNIKAEYSSRERGTVMSDMYKEMINTINGFNGKLKNAVIYHLKYN